MDEYNFEIPRPDLSLLKAVESDDLPAAVLVALRNWLMPGEEVKWVTHLPDGFWWVPYRLKHSVEVLRKESTNGENRWICRSTITLVEEVDDVMACLGVLSYLNSLSFGASVWWDPDSKSIKATSWTKLDPEDWYLTLCFQSAVGEKIGICEILAPRLAELVNGKAPLVSHPVHGVRQEPDQFIVDCLGFFNNPEATLGTWWAENEIETFRNFLETAFGNDIDLKVETSEFQTAAVNLFTEFIVEKDMKTQSGDIQSMPHSVFVKQANHPELGRGIEIFLETPFDLCPNAEMSEPEGSWKALMLANVLNGGDADACAESIGISGWFQWRGKLCLSTFIKATPVAYLQNQIVSSAYLQNQIVSSASPSDMSYSPIGVFLGLLTTTVLERADNPAEAITHDFYKEDWSLTEDTRCRGVDDIFSSFNLLLTNDRENFEYVAADLSLELNTLEESPAQIGYESLSDCIAPYLWDTPTSLLASYGIFNPAGPSVGSLEMAVSQEFDQALLIERLRHPHFPHIIVHALIDDIHLLDEFVGKVIEKFNWSTLDWFEIVKDTEDFNEAVLKGLTKFGERLEKEENRDLRQEAIRLQFPPWERLAIPTEKKLVKLFDTGLFKEEFFLQNDDLELDYAHHLSDVDFWTTALISSSNVDHHIKFLRSAWEGSKLFQIDVAQAQSVADTITAWVETRK